MTYLIVALPGAADLKPGDRCIRGVDAYPLDRSLVR